MGYFPESVMMMMMMMTTMLPYRAPKSPPLVSVLIYNNPAKAS
jgi:hypothetical protein